MSVFEGLADRPYEFRNDPRQPGGEQCALRVAGSAKLYLGETPEDVVLAAMKDLVTEDHRDAAQGSLPLGETPTSMCP